jgi:hypothetical protein
VRIRNIKLVRNIIMKYGISDIDFYNFDKIEFIIGIISIITVIINLKWRVKTKKI